MIIRIETGIAIPKTRVGRPRRYPFKQMSVGDSFALSNGMTAQQVREAVRYFRKGNSGRFIVRKHENGWRCWRVE